MAKKDETKKPEAETAATGTASQGEQTSDDTNMVRKISPKTVLGGPAAIRKAIAARLKDMGEVDQDGEPKQGVNAPLYNCIGVAYRVKEGTGDNGPWVAFLGAFEAINFTTGETFQGGQAFVPKAVEDLMVAALRAGQKDDPHASIQFGIEVGAKLADTSIGYEFTIKNLVKTANADPLAALRGALSGVAKPKALTQQK